MTLWAGGPADAPGPGGSKTNTRAVMAAQEEDEVVARRPARAMMSTAEAARPLAPATIRAAAMTTMESRRPNAPGLGQGTETRGEGAAGDMMEAEAVAMEAEAMEAAAMEAVAMEAVAMEGATRGAMTP